MTSPFRHLLSDAFDRLPEAVRRLHDLSTETFTAGKADITASSHPLAWALCKIAGLPKPGSGVPVTVDFRPDDKGQEFWERHFAGRRYASTMETGNGCLIEHFGPFDLMFDLKPAAEGLEWSLAGWKLLGVPLPHWSKPRIDCLETGDGERFVFDIDVAFPVVGHVVHYRGWLEEVGREVSGEDV